EPTGLKPVSFSHSDILPGGGGSLLRVAKRLRFGKALELLQRVVLDLADALAGDPECADDLLERAGLLALQAEAQLDHLALALGQRVERAVDVLAPQRHRRRIERGDGLLVGDEVAQLGLLLLADRLLEADRELRHALDLAHLVGRHAELGGDLLRPRLAAEPLHQLALDVDDPVELLDHVHRDANGARLIGDRPRHGLADPPRRVRRELVPLAVVELLDGADEAEAALLDQVEKGEAAAQIALRDRDDEAQVGFGHLLLREHVAALDPLGQADLLVGGEQRDLADLAQVEPERVEARLDGQVELGRLLAVEGRILLRRLPRLGVQELDVVVQQVGVEVLQLFLRELDFLQRGRNLVEREVALLVSFLDQGLELFDLRKRDIDRQHGPPRMLRFSLTRSRRTPHPGYKKTEKPRKAGWGDETDRRRQQCTSGYQARQGTFRNRIAPSLSHSCHELDQRDVGPQAHDRIADRV